MSKLPVVSGREAIKAFAKIGFEERRVQGSHHIFKSEGHPVVLSIPVHGNRPLKPGLLRAQIRAAGITVDQFCELLD